jgi:hypothetical protein
MTDIEDVEGVDPEATEIDPADLVAELDDEPPDDLPDDDYDDDAEMFSGVAHDGPLDGQQIESRYPKGFLLIDMENEHVWIYDRREGGGFYARNTEPVKADEDGRWRAAEEEDYDILVPDMAAGDEDYDGGDGE